MIRSSLRQFQVKPAGQKMITREIRPRLIISRIYRPVIMVLPAPASSARRNRKRILGKKIFIDRNPLMGKRNNTRKLKAESFIKKMPVLKSVSIYHEFYRVRIAFKVQTRDL